MFLKKLKNLMHEVTFVSTYILSTFQKASLPPPNFDSVIRCRRTLGCDGTETVALIQRALPASICRSLAGLLQFMPKSPPVEGHAVPS